MPCPSLLTPCQAERKAQGILEKSLGKEDPRTKDSQHWVQTFLERELKVGRAARGWRDDVPREGAQGRGEYAGERVRLYCTSVTLFGMYGHVIRHSSIDFGGVAVCRS